MSNEVSPWVKKVVRVYVILVMAGAFLGFASGGLAGIFVMPLLLPWIAIVPILEVKTGKPLLDIFWMGPLITLISGAINAYLLFMILKFVDRRRRGKAASHSEPAR